MKLELDHHLNDLRFAEGDESPVYKGTFVSEDESVLRFSWDIGLFRLAFSVDPAHWDDSVVRLGQAYLNYSHSVLQLGNVDDISFHHGAGHFEATTVTAVSPEVQQILQNMRDQRLRGVSMEIDLWGMELVEKDSEKGDLFRGIDQRFNGLAVLMRPAFKQSGLAFDQGSARGQQLRTLMFHAYEEAGEPVPEKQSTSPQIYFTLSQVQRIIQAERGAK